MTKGLARAGFDLDLEEGQYREGALAEILRLRYGPLIEIKSDFKCRQTGSLFIEYEQKGRPSGIQTTEADWWAFEYFDDCWVIVPTVILRRLVAHAWAAGRRKKGGDFNAYDGVLVPLEALFTFAELAA